MKTINAIELTGHALRWAVLECENGEGAAWYIEKDRFMEEHGEVSAEFAPDIRWATGGPIIEREGISIVFRGDAHEWVASLWSYELEDWYLHTEGSTPLVAAMRCYVASKLGEEVEIPEELLK